VSDGFYTVKVKNTNSTNPGQTAYVKVTYTAPMTVSTSTYPAVAERAAAERTPLDLAGVAPSQVSLSVYPVPSPGTSQVVFELPAASRIELSILDLAGRRIRKLADGSMPAGRQVVPFNGETLPAGVYIIRLNTSAGMEMKKIVIARK
jgi:hypothetical protein